MRAAASVMITAMFLSPGADASTADSFYCGPRLVQVGDTRLDIRARCGAATTEDRRIEQRKDGSIVTVDEWTYNLGPNRFTPTFRFEDGKLVHIEVGDHGYVK